MPNESWFSSCRGRNPSGNPLNFLSLSLNVWRDFLNGFWAASCFTMNWLKPLPCRELGHTQLGPGNLCSFPTGYLSSWDRQGSNVELRTLHPGAHFNNGHLLQQSCPSVSGTVGVLAPSTSVHIACESPWVEYTQKSSQEENLFILYSNWSSSRCVVPLCSPPPALLLLCYGSLS